MQIKEYFTGSQKFYSCRIWYEKNKIRKSKYKRGFIRRKDARLWGLNEERKLKGLQIGADKLLVKDFLDKWLAYKKDKLSPTTAAGYENCIQHIKNCMGNCLLREIKLFNVQDMLDDLRKKFKHNSVKYVYRTLHAALNYAIKCELLEKNACKGAEIKEDEDKFKASIYSPMDLNKLLMLLREQEHPIYAPVLLASMRGLRRGECLGLQWEDIDFDSNIGHIINNYVVVKGIQYLKKVKTKESERVIDVSGFVGDELKLIRERQLKSGIIQTYVCSTNGNIPSPSHLSKQLQSFQDAHKLPHCRFHDLRHTFAMLQVENGTDLDTLKRLLGHSKIGVTSDMYLHPNLLLIKKASAKLDNIVSLNCAESVQKSKKDNTG